MPVKIRLQRHGKKGKPFYWVVAADSRAKRDGKYLEKLGVYNPNTNPAVIDLDVDGAVKWLQNGAQPSETAKRLLSYKGAMLKHHLMGGVAKGALTEEEAEKKFQAWLEEKQAKIEAKKENLSKEEAQARAEAKAAEKKANEARIAAAAPAEEEVAEETSAEATEEAPAAEEAPAKEAPAAETSDKDHADEAHAEKAKEEPKKEEAEAPKAEAKKEEKKAANEEE
ncbi:30S ribosomal protein S16 [Croceiramulus getboli]|nr:30S ribosomal protein S16 [Flavobacteriaceae bacterium YJPT1-3]